MLTAIVLSLILSKQKYVASGPLVHQNPSQPKVERKITRSPQNKTIDVKATAYCPDEGRIGGGHKTKTGDHVKYGVIAVDPRIIPLYTKVHIDGYGDAIALDTGGNIKKNHIDLAFESVDEMNQWGARHVRIRVLEEPAYRGMSRNEYLMLRKHYGLPVLHSSKSEHKHRHKKSHKK